MQQILFLFWLLISCEPSKSYRLHVTVQDNMGNALPNSWVRLNDQSLGVTDGTGTLITTQGFAFGSQLKIEAGKDDQNAYFAPYQEHIEITPTTQQDLSLAITLYTLPKMQEDAVPAVVEKPVVEPVKAVEVAKVEEPVKPVTPEKEEKPVKEDVQEKVKIAEKVEKPIKQEIPVVLEKKETIVTVVSVPAAEEKTEEVVAIKRGTYVLLVEEQKKPVSEIEVRVASEENPHFQLMGKSNERGICTLHVPLSKHPITFLLRKPGYRSQKFSTRIVDQGKRLIHMVKGRTLDIFTQKYASQPEGFHDVEIAVNRNKLGKPDRFGHLSYWHKGEAEELLEVTLTTTKALPVTFQTHFVAMDGMLLEKSFAPLQREIRQGLSSSPIEGTILAYNPSLQQVELSLNSRDSVQIGTAVAIYGLQSDDLGRKKEYRKIADGEIIEITGERSISKISHLLPHAKIEVGDLVTVSQLELIPAQSPAIGIRVSEPTDAKAKRG